MRRSVPLLAVALAAGCSPTTDARYPSLLPRPIEGTSLDEPERPVQVATPDPALDARIAALAATLDKGASDFTASAREAEARVAVARGVPEGSEAWVNAQLALSDLDTIRAPVSGAMSELEELAIARGEAGQPPYPALDAAIARASALVTDQSARSRALEAALAGN